MKFKDRLYYRFAKIFPINYRNHLAQQIIYTGEFIDVHIYLGSATLLAFLALFGLIIAPKALFLEFNFTYFFYGLLAFILIQLIAYMAIYFKAEDRTKRVEAVLPDALQLIASNIHAGMTPFQALKSAERKEFGPLREEIHHAIAQSMGTESFAVALNSISKRINSEMLERALKLFTTSMQSGGHLAILLEELAKDIQATRNLKNELITNTKTYTAFILFTIMCGAPLLLAISIQFISIIGGLQTSTISSSTATFGLGMLSSQLIITTEFLTNLSFVMLTITGLLASILIGVITTGKPKHGFKFAPLIVFGSLLIFFILKWWIGSFFSGII